MEQTQIDKEVKLITKCEHLADDIKNNVYDFEKLEEDNISLQTWIVFEHIRQVLDSTSSYLRVAKVRVTNAMVRDSVLGGVLLILEDLHIHLKDDDKHIHILCHDGNRMLRKLEKLMNILYEKVHMSLIVDGYEREYTQKE